MQLYPSRTDLPVLLLNNLDPSWPNNDIQESRASANLLKDDLVNLGHPVHTVCLQSDHLEQASQGYNPDEILVFNWCEEIPGIPHSAAQVVLTLDRLGFTYTGASAEALTLSQDKPRVKSLLSAHRIPTPQWQIASSATVDDWDSFPAIVKPAFEHCSFGVTRDAVVLSHFELSERIRYVLDAFQQPALVEEFIDGRELHISVLGNGNLKALPPAEMDFSAFGNVKDRLCTYESKFDPDSASYNLIELHLPAPLTRTELSQLEATALSAYRATDCRDYARLDLRFREGIFYVLDVNPNSDLSPDTSLAMSAELVGLSYGQLGSYLINLAAERHLKYGLRKEGMP